MHLQKCLTFGVHINFVKFERYQKQFHFLIDNNIETTGQLNDVKQNAEDKIAELTLKRTRLYSKPDTKNEEDLIAENQRLRMENEYLKKLSALVRKRMLKEEKKQQ